MTYSEATQNDVILTLYINHKQTQPITPSFSSSRTNLISDPRLLEIKNVVRGRYCSQRTSTIHAGVLTYIKLDTEQQIKEYFFFFSQPKPDPALLNTEQPKSGIVADDTAKVNIVSPDFKRDPTTVTSEKHPIEDVSESDGEDNTNGSEKRKRRVRRKLQEAEQEAVDVWTVAKEKLFQPGVAGGLVGVGE